MKKIVYFVFAIGMIIWLGGSLTRNVIIFDSFVAGTELVYKSGYSDDRIYQNIYLFTSASLYTNVAYGISFICMIYIAVAERKSLKKQGWLFMSVVLFFISSPIILYNIYLDFGLSRAIFYNDLSFLNHLGLREVIFRRFQSTANTVLSGLAYIANVNLIAYSIFRPLNRTGENITQVNEIN